MACAVLQAVVNANYQSSGNGQLSIHRGPKATERISMKLGIYNYVGCLTAHAYPYGGATTWVVSTNTRLVICFDFLAYVFFLFCFTLYFGSRRDRTVRPILTVYTSYDVFPRKEVPFGGRRENVAHLGVKSFKNPNLEGGKRHFKPN